MQLHKQMKRVSGQDWLCVKVAGELDMAVADQFRDQLIAALQETHARNLLLDFSALDFIDSSGLGVILGRLRQLAPQGGRIAISGANQQVYRLLTASGLHKVIEVDRPSSIAGQAEMGS